MKADPGIHPRLRRMRTRLPLHVLLAAAVTIALAAQQRPIEPSLQGEGSLKVMTYNMFTGTEYANVANPNYEVFLQAVTNMIEEARASDPAGRAQAIARQIATTQPHLVSMQELATWSTGPTRDDLNMELDYLQLVLDALNELGTPYVTVYSNTTWDITLPSSTGGYVRHTWGVAVIARADLTAEDFSYTGFDGARWEATLNVRLRALEGIHSAECPEPLRPSDSSCRVPVGRGWVSADVTYRGKQVRIIGAHVDHPPFGNAQIDELLDGPADTTLPVILAGDLNCDLSDPGDPAYVWCQKLIDAGFVDAWGAANPSEAGYTKDLPDMTMRGDYVMVRGRFVVQAAVLVGEEEDDMTESGLWPSNHCGVVAKVQFPEEN